MSVKIEIKEVEPVRESERPRRIVIDGRDCGRIKRTTQEGQYRYHAALSFGGQLLMQGFGFSAAVALEQAVVSGRVQAEDAAADAARAEALLPDLLGAL